VINTESDKRDAFITKIGALSPASPPTTIHFDIPIATGDDDAEEKGSGSVSLDSSDLELVYDGSNQKVGLRFTGVDIPSGATILNASIQFVVDETSSGTTSLTIQAQAVDDAPAFTSSSNDISSRPRTSASVPWIPVSWNTEDEAGPDQRTPDLASVVQEVVDRQGWTSGNAMVFIITGTGERVAKSYERDVYGAPYLHIEYTLSTPTPTPTPTLTSTPPVTETPTLTPAATDTPLPTFTPTLPPTITPTPIPSGPLTIDYTYDALHRITSATYSDGRSFGYTYDAAGNVLELEQDLGSGTETTTYTYNAANELVTATVNGTTWNYTYDANGSLTEVLPNGNPGNGAKRYIYNSAGNLVQVEAHNGTGWDTQAEMSYNGLGQRLSMTAAGVTSTYIMDGDRPLTAESAGNTTYYLYGLGTIGEKTTAWNFSLPDGTNTPRQLTDIQGDITLTSRYTPWGDTLETYGTGNFSFGYLGGVLDATTGLLYVGNGQYYDPATGRFLTRNVNPDSTNPYVPWNPIGAIVGPLGLIALVFGRRKKGSKAGTFLVLLLVVGSVGMTLSACGQSGNVTVTLVTTPNAPVAVATATFDNGVTVTATLPASGGAPTEVMGVPCQTPENTVTPIGTPIPGFLDAELQLYDVKFAGNLSAWTAFRVQAVKEAVIAVATRMTQVAGGGRSAIEVFRLVYEGVTFTWANTDANGGCSIGTGGCTSSGHDINFADLSDDPVRARNNIVHELGHAFSKFWSETQPIENEIAYARQHPEEVNPVIVLGWVQDYQGYPEYYVAGFPKRKTPALGDITLGDFSGFASQQNQLTWQVAVTNAGLPSEVYADQFLGWTFDTWQRKSDGSLHSDATLRRNFMDKYMPGWINYRIYH